MNDLQDLLNINYDIFYCDSKTSTMTSSGDQSNLVQRVSVKVPPFWNDSPDIWFVQVESQFSNAGITTDESKFNTVVGAIESKILSHVREAVLNPPVGTKYTNLKEKLLKEFADSDYTNMKKLFSELSLGDNKPTFLLNEMRRLGGANVTDDVLKTLWMNQLPVQARAILATSTATLTELANTADKIVEVSSLSVVQQIEQTKSSSIDNRMSFMEKQINQLVSVVHSFKNQHGQSRSRSRSKSFQGKRNQTPNHSRSRNETPNNSRSRNENPSDLCWYHITFGNSATKCKETCRLYEAKN